MLGVAGAIDSFKIVGGLTIERHAAGSYVNGNYTVGAVTTFTADPIVVHIATGKEMLRLPEGVRTRKAVAVYTKQPLQTASAPGGNDADVVLYGSERFEVQTLEDWYDNGGFYKAIATKEGR